MFRCANAANKTVNMKDVDANKSRQVNIRGETIFIVILMLTCTDGYACAEDCTVNNTDKNYTIPNLTAGTNDLQVSDAKWYAECYSNFCPGIVAVFCDCKQRCGGDGRQWQLHDVDGQVGMLISMANHVLHPTKESEMKQRQKIRIRDETYWGGTASTAGSDTAKNRVSYHLEELYIRKCSCPSGQGKVAAQILQSS